MKKRRVRLAVGVGLAIAALCVVFLILVLNGTIIPNRAAATKYPVRGVDISSYQGEVDWQTLAAQDIAFVFLKATEGSSFVDKSFAYNYEEAVQTELAVGAYHFFSYDSAGATQAENFIRTVAPHDGMLPPVIDLEFYGDKEQHPPKREAVTRELKTMLDRATTGNMTSGFAV